MQIRIHYILIPGNPSASFYYLKWIEELQLIYPDARFSYMPPPPLKRNITSDESFEYILASFEFELAKFAEDDVSLCILGHSIGGFFAKKLLERQLVAIDQVILLFPFLGDLHFSTKIVLNCVNWLYYCEILSKQFIKHKNLFKFLSPEIKNITAAELESSLNLAKHEHDFFKCKIEDISITLVDKIKVIVTKNDRWCCESTIKRLKTVLRPIEIESKHDYILLAVERNKVAQHIL